MATFCEYGNAATAALHGVRRCGGEPLAGGIVQSTTYVQEGVGGKGHAYSRVSNPTVDDLELALGALEDAPPAVAFSSGLAAETALFLALLRAGSHAVVGRGVYGGTTRLFQQVLGGLGVRATIVDATDTGAVAAAVERETALIFVETPANPTLELTDIRGVAAIARARGVKLVVDNTFLTPVLQRVLDLGADAAVYSTTKHIEGHSSALGGAVTSRDAGLLELVRFIRKSVGSIQTPHNAWLTLRGIETLPLRLKRHSRSAQRVAEWLASHPAVAGVNYPGLERFAQAELAAVQHVGAAGGGHGGVLSFEFVEGFEAAREFLRRLRLVKLVEHVGGVHTLATHSASMTHADVPRDQRLAAGIGDGLVRLSIGLEEVEDIIADLAGAIEGAGLARGAAREEVACERV